MSQTDALYGGLAESAGDPAALSAYAAFAHRILRIAPGAEEILEMRRQMPDEPVLALGEALFWLFGQTAEAQQACAEALAKAEASALDETQTRWLGALQLWHAHDFDRAASAFEEITSEDPTDLTAAKACEFVYYILGQQHCGPRFRTHMQRLSPQYAGNPDFLAMHAFAHELCGEMGPARTAAEQALEIEPLQPWAHHALEHVLLWEGNPEAAMQLMKNWARDWEACARPIHSHNAWHYAVALLDRLEVSAAFEVFDTHVWMKTPGVVTEQLDTVSFLWRVEMAGHEVPRSRWDTLLPVVQQASGELFMPFASAHYAYALARGGGMAAAEPLLAAVAERSAMADAEAVRVWRPTGRHVVEASAALGCGRVREAADAFDTARPRLTEIGGSDAQDDLFRFAHMTSLAASGRQSAARELLASRLTSKPASPLEEHWMQSFSIPTP